MQAAASSYDKSFAIFLWNLCSNEWIVTHLRQQSRTKQSQGAQYNGEAHLHKRMKE